MKIQFATASDIGKDEPEVPYLGLYERFDDPVLVIVGHDRVTVVAGPPGTCHAGPADSWDITSNPKMVLDYITPLSKGDIISLWSE